MAFNAYGNRFWLIAAVALQLSGCNTIFDGPAGSTGLDGLSDQTLSDVQAIARGQSLEALGTIPTSEAFTGVAQEGLNVAVQTGALAATRLNSPKVTRLSAPQGREPAIYFEKISSPMPQLVVLSAGSAVVRWNDTQLLMPEGNASHVTLVLPGKQALTIEYADATVFKAEIVIARYERVTLRVDATPSIGNLTNQ